MQKKELQKILRLCCKHKCTHFEDLSDDRSYFCWCKKYNYCLVGRDEFVFEINRNPLCKLPEDKLYKGRIRELNKAIRCLKKESK